MPDQREPHEYGMALLAPLRAEPLGRTSVDIAAAARVGRRRRLRRQVGTAGSAALAVAVLAVAVNQAVRPVDTVGPPPSTGAPAVAAFDPRYQAVTLTPPSPFRVRSVMTGYHTQTIMLSGGEIGDGNVTMSEPGLFPSPGGSPVPPNAQPIAPIGGRPAYWDPCPQPGDPAGPGDRESCATVYWEWYEDAWAIVMVDLRPRSSAATGALDYAVAIAAATSYAGDSLPVRVPMRVAAPPDTSLRAVIVNGPDRVDVVFGRDGRVSGPPVPRQVVVSARSDLPRDPGATDTVDGHQASIEDTEVTIYRMAGAWSLRVTSQPENVFGDGASLLAFARTVEFVANPDDRSTWITPE